MSLRESDFNARSNRLDSALGGTRTPSSVLMGELGLAVIAVRKECRPLSSAQKALLKQCLLVVRTAWPSFGSFGLAYFTYGKKQSALVPALAGVTLMVFPYFVSNNYLLAGIGAALMALPFFVRL